MSRPLMYVPSSFTAEKESQIEFKDCRFYTQDLFRGFTPNCFKKSFKRQESIEGWDIILEDPLPVFKDKLDTYTGLQEERLV